MTPFCFFFHLFHPSRWWRRPSDRLIITHDAFTSRPTALKKEKKRKKSCGLLWETNGIPGRQMMEEDTGCAPCIQQLRADIFSFRPGSQVPSHSQSRRLLCDFPVIYFMIPFSFKAASTFQPYNMCARHTHFIFSWKIKNKTSKFAARNSKGQEKRRVSSSWYDWMMMSFLDRNLFGVGQFLLRCRWHPRRWFFLPWAEGGGAKKCQKVGGR